MTPSEASRQRTSSGEGADPHVDEDRRAVVRAALGVFDRDRHVLRRGLLSTRSPAPSPGSGVTRELEEGRRLAREPAMPERVGTVRRQPDLEDGVARGGERVDERRPRRDRARRQHEDAVAVVAEARARPRCRASLRSGPPRSCAARWSRPWRASSAPSGARTTSPPGSGTLGAPHTSSCVREALASTRDPPWSTVTRRRPLRDGCGRVETTLATTHASAPRPKACVASTSSPAAVRRAAIAVASSGSEGHSSRSHRTEAFIRGPWVRHA